jgi:hypothetical protein
MCLSVSVHLFVYPSPIFVSWLMRSPCCLSLVCVSVSAYPSVCVSLLVFRFMRHIRTRSLQMLRKRVIDVGT